MFKFTATVLAAMAFCGAAQAQSAYPNKPIRLLVPLPLAARPT
jgi:tripartite-type tricarboxylate transporter receptor subunit TctC